PGTLTGENAASAWTLAMATTYDDRRGHSTLALSGFATLQGGTAVDTFTVTAPSAVSLKGGAGADVFDLGASLTGALDGAGDRDTLRGSQFIDVTLTGSGASGFAGTTTAVTGGFAGIDVVTGAGPGTLTGEDKASTWALSRIPTYNDGT